MPQIFPVENYSFSQLKIHNDFAIGIGHALKVTFQIPNEQNDYDLKQTGAKEFFAICIPNYDHHLINSLDDIIGLIDKIKEIKLDVMNDFDVPWVGLVNPKFPKVPKRKARKAMRSDGESEENSEDEEEDSDENEDEEEEEDNDDDNSDDKSAESDKSSEQSSDEEDSEGSIKKKKKDKKDKKANQKLSFLTSMGNVKKKRRKDEDDDDIPFD